MFSESKYEKHFGKQAQKMIFSVFKTKYCTSERVTTYEKCAPPFIIYIILREIGSSTVVNLL